MNARLKVACSIGLLGLLFLSVSARADNLVPVISTYSTTAFDEDYGTNTNDYAEAAVLHGNVDGAPGVWSGPTFTDNTYTYSYVGNTFTYAVAPYTYSDFVTGTLVLSAPLPSDLLSLTGESSLVLSYSFSDGVQTLANADYSQQPDNSIFQFTTDDSGDIGQYWFVQLYPNPTPAPEPSSFLLLGTGLLALVGLGLAAEFSGQRLSSHLTDTRIANH